MYHYSRVEPLFYDDEKHMKLLLPRHLLFLVDIYEVKLIIAVLLDIFFISCLFLLLPFFLNAAN